MAWKHVIQFTDYKHAFAVALSISTHSNLNLQVLYFACQSYQGLYLRRLFATPSYDEVCIYNTWYQLLINIYATRVLAHDEHFRTYENDIMLKPPIYANPPPPQPLFLGLIS